MKRPSQRRKKRKTEILRRNNIQRTNLNRGNKNKNIKSKSLLKKTKKSKTKNPKKLALLKQESGSRKCMKGLSPQVRKRAHI